MTKTILMCRPTYFQVDYDINPWMTNNVHRVDVSLAQQQWQDFYHHLRQYRQVELIEPHPGVPDLVFTANFGVVKDKRVIVSNFRYPQRQSENQYFVPWFQEHGYEIFDIPPDIDFEGGGDVLFHSEHSVLWMGYGFRSDRKVQPYIEQYCDMPAVPLQLINPRFYHLDTCLCPLLDGHVMYYPGAFDQASQQLIHKHVPAEKQIVVSQADAGKFACNAVTAKTEQARVIFISNASEALQQQLTQIGYQVMIQSVAEFNKSGGANRCLTLVI